MGDEPKKKAMKKAGAASGSDRMRRFSAATGAKIEETEDGAIKVSGAQRQAREIQQRWLGAHLAPRPSRDPSHVPLSSVQAHNPFLEMLSEEEEEEEKEVYIEEAVIELVKGPSGFGMDITDVSLPDCPSVCATRGRR